MTPANAMDAKSKPALGFLTVLEHDEHGLFGGYLTLDMAGRPLEFHCTAPIKPNRPQQILYGPTLEPFLFGEQIGQTLLERAAIDPLVVCTDRLPALAVREYVDVPVALVLQSEPAAADQSPPEERPGKQWRLDSAHSPDLRLSEFRLGCNLLAVPARAADDRQKIVDRLGAMADGFDLAEPFDRIREAIEEARRGG
jgi:hypothetical protein